MLVNNGPEDPGHSTPETAFLSRHHLDLPQTLSVSAGSGRPSLSLLYGSLQMLTGKPAILKSSSDLLDASVVSTTSRYIEEQQATQQVRAGSWQPQAGGDCGQLRAPCQPRFPPFYPAADPGPAGSTAGNGVWEHLSSETHVRPSWGGAGRAGHVRLGPRGWARSPWPAALVCTEPPGADAFLVLAVCWTPLLRRWTTPSPGWMGSLGRWPKYPT